MNAEIERFERGADPCESIGLVLGMNEYLRGIADGRFAGLLD